MLLIEGHTKSRFLLSVSTGGHCWEWTGKRDKDGYGTFNCRIAGARYSRASRVAWVMHNRTEVPTGYCVLHTCDNPCCVRPDHLRLGTLADNTLDMLRKGRHRVPKGDASPHSKLLERQVIEILADPRPYREIAEEYGVAQMTVSSIKNRASWGHLTAEAVRGKRASPRKGKSDKLTEDDIRLIRSGSETGRALAERFGVSVQTICDIRKRRSWAHVT